MMSLETATALLELCAIIEGWPGKPAQERMAKFKQQIADDTQQWLCRCGKLNGPFRTKCGYCGAVAL